VRIDHRTLKEQGIERDAQRHAGKGAIGVWAEITAHNAQVKEDAEELARLDAEYAATTEKLKDIMREIELTNEPRKPFIPTTEAEAGQLRRRFEGLIEKRMDNHKSDVARVTELETRLNELYDIHHSQPQFWEYRKKKAKAAADIEYRQVEDEWRGIKHLKDTHLSHNQARQAVLQEFPEYVPALQEHDRFVAIVQKRIDESLAESEAKRQQHENALWFEQERAKEAQEAAKVAELAQKPPEREIEPLAAKETPPKKRNDNDNDNGPSM
jgi:hypothetical protein